MFLITYGLDSTQSALEIDFFGLGIGVTVLGWALLNLNGFAVAVTYYLLESQNGSSALMLAARRPHARSVGFAGTSVVDGGSAGAATGGRDVVTRPRTAHHSVSQLSFAASKSTPRSAASQVTQQVSYRADILNETTMT